MDLSPEQIERSQRTIRAAGVFADHAEVIAAHVRALPEDHVVVAVVTVDYVFNGVHHVSREELVERVPALEGEGGWAMVFSPGADVEHVGARTAEMVALAEKRIEMISRIAARRNG
jgi:cyclopropane fatty-acyl-phospholipid synthase-like methyltransferase